jgi:hypothetical protein
VGTAASVRDTERSALILAHDAGCRKGTFPPPMHHTAGFHAIPASVVSIIAAG